MKSIGITIAILLVWSAGILSACGPVSTPAAEPAPPTVEPTESPLSATEEPSPSPLPEDITPEFVQAIEIPFEPVKQPAAPPHFKAGEKFRLDFIHMSTDTEGWAISGPFVLRTRDGGKSWQEVTPPESLPEGTFAMAYGTFPDEYSAWVIFGFDSIGADDPRYAYFQIPPTASVWATFDGGETWIAGPPLMHEVYGDATWAEFAAVDEATGWMMVRGVYIGAGIHHVAQLFQTVDGIAWIPIPNSDVGVDYTGMVFADKDNGWLTWQTTGAYAAAPPEVAMTSDGGYNWDVMDLPPPDDAPDLFSQYEYCEPYQPNLLSAQSIRLLVACSYTNDSPEDFTSYLYASDDAGENWQINLLPEKVNASGYTLIFFDDETSLLLGRDIYRSEDGGETWDLIKTVNWDGQFSFVDDQTGWAIARNGEELALVQTTNGGETWSKLEPVAMR